MMHVGERISVIASFGPSYVLRPLRFRWAGRLMDVREVTYTWKTFEGEDEEYHFSVRGSPHGGTAPAIKGTAPAIKGTAPTINGSGGTETSEGLYELVFDTGTLLWRLEALEA